jgi:hypothetical protein
VDYWECKACTALTKAESGVCWKCGHVRGAEVVAPETPLEPNGPHASARKEPRLGHVVQSFLMFAVAGPVIGLFAFLLQNGPSRWSLFEVVIPFGLIGAYVVGGPLAVITGLLHGFCCVALVAVFPRVVISVFAGAVLGFCVAALAIHVWAQLLLSIPAVREMRVREFLPLALGTSAVCGALSGWRYPVGRVVKAGTK